MPRSRPNPHGRPRRRALPPELRRVNLNAAGIDVGAEGHFVAVPDGRDPEGQSVRQFGAFTADLHALAEWLRRCGVDTVAMESTGVYWIPLFELLAGRGFEVKLVDPRQLKHVPGRKTDGLLAVRLGGRDDLHRVLILGDRPSIQSRMAATPRTSRPSSRTIASSVKQAAQASAS